MNRDKVRIVLNRANPTLRTQLNLDDDLCVSLKATDPEIISDNEHEDITSLSTQWARIDRLLNIIKRKPVRVYLEFMGILQEKDIELYERVKAIQDAY